MMRLQDATYLATFLTSKFVVFQNFYTPFSVFCASILGISIPSSFGSPSLIVRQFIPFLHCLAIHIDAFWCFQHLPSAIRDFLGTFRAFVNTFYATIPLVFTFGSKLNFASFANYCHYIPKRKNPLPTKALLSRQHPESRQRVCKQL